MRVRRYVELERKYPNKAGVLRRKRTMAQFTYTYKSQSMGRRVQNGCGINFELL